MQPEDLPGADPNTLPYFITEAQTGSRVPARFEPLTLQDAAELNNEDWQNAVFKHVWPQLLTDENTFKLVCVSSTDTRIQGVAHVGSVLWAGGLLEKSLLETAPFNLYGQSMQTYQGTGRALVARLVVGSILQGGQGRVGVVPRPGSEAFYQRLGFQPGKTFRLSSINAQALLQTALLPVQETKEEAE